MSPTNLTDILGPEGAAASPSAVRTVARQLGDVRDAAEYVQRRVSSLEAGSWTGDAANAFDRRRSDELANQLSQVHNSFGAASASLGSYAGQLDRILSDARWLAGQRESAAASLAAAQRQEQASYAALSHAKSVRNATAEPVARARADTAVTGAQGKVSNARSLRQSAEDALRKLDARAEALREQLVSCAQTCKSGIEAATNAGMKNSFNSKWNRHVVNGIPGAVVTDMYQTAKEFVDASANLWGTGLDVLIDAVNGNFSMENLDLLAKAYSRWVDAAKPIIDALAVAALVVAAVVICAGGPAGWVAGAFLVSRVAGFVNLGLDGGKIVADTELAARGKGTWGTVINDGVTIGVDAASVAISAGDASGAASKLGTAQETLARTGTSQAQSSVTKHIVTLQQEFLLQETVDLGEDISKAGLKLLTSDLDAMFGPVAPVAPSPAGPPILLHGPYDGLLQGPNSSVRHEVTQVTAPAVVFQ